MVSTRIICIGNRYVEGDDLGPRIYDRLAQEGHCDFEVIDGGLGGLRLLGLVEGVERVVFVDTVFGYAEPGQCVTLSPDELGEMASPHYGHDAGLPYLMAVLPKVVDPPLPSIEIFGVERGAPETELPELVRTLVRLVRADRRP